MVHEAGRVLADLVVAPVEDVRVDAVLAAVVVGLAKAVPVDAAEADPAAPVVVAAVAVAD